MSHETSPKASNSNLPNLEMYLLATGETAIERLRIVEATHGADTQNFLKRAGLKEGLRVADIGCGVGLVSQWIAQQVSPSGEVLGVDVSSAQVETATRLATEAGISNVRYSIGSAYNTGLPKESFDLVYCRFLLMHLANPLQALQEMHSLLKPGGILAVEDGDFTAPFCWPPSKAFERCFELYRAAGARQGAHFEIGKMLFELVCKCGLKEVQLTLAQPIFSSGPQKSLPGWTIEEAASNLVQWGLATQEEINALCADMERLAANKEVVFAMARMMQVWGHK